MIGHAGLGSRTLTVVIIKSQSVTLTFTAIPAPSRQRWRGKVSGYHRGTGRSLVDYFNGLEVDERVTFVPRTGWHNVGDRRVFVLPGESFGASELVLLNTDAASSPYGYHGALTDWQNGIGRLTAGQRLGALAVATAFAGPLLHLSGQDGGGIHIRGSSSTGKTSLARAAASVWGPRTYMRSWRATANGLEGAAVLATDTLLVLDELGVIDSRELNAAVYQLAIGAGKGRARRDGSMRTPASWRVMVVSTGEVSIASKVEEDRNRRARAGQEVRILDIPADAGKGYGAFDAPRAGEDSAAGLADEIVSSAEEFHGTAGPAFLQAVIDFGIDKIITSVNTAIETFCANVGQIRQRWSDPTSCAAPCIDRGRRRAGPRSRYRSELAEG